MPNRTVSESFDASHLWWPSFGLLYDDLSHPMKTSIEDVGGLLQVNQNKLLRVLSFFQTPNPETRQVVASGSGFHVHPSCNIELSEQNDPIKSELALKASEILELDAIQCYFLLLHYCRIWTNKMNNPMEINMHELQEFYHQERKHLLKCLELMIQDGEASPFWLVTSSMMDKSLDAQVAHDIICILHNCCEASNKCLGKNVSNVGDNTLSSSPGIMQICPEEKGCRQVCVLSQTDALLEDMNELCSLLDIMLAIWDDPLGSVSCKIWLELAEAFQSHLLILETNLPCKLSDVIKRAQNLAALLMIQGLGLDRVLHQMYHTDASDEADLSRSPHAANRSSSAVVGGQNESSTRGKRNVEHVSDTGSLFPNLLPNNSKTNLADRSKHHDLVFSSTDRSSISEALGLWCCKGPTLLQAPCILGWAAFLILNDSLSFDIDSDPAQTWKHINLLVASAWETGGFASILHLAKADGLSVDYNLASVYKNIQTNLFIAILAAFGISPLTLSPSDLETVLQTTYHLFSDQPGLCSMFWDVNILSKEPMFHFLDVARDMFPAVPMPLLHLLACVSNGPQNATQVHNYLARLPSLTFQHSIDDPDIIMSSAERGGMVLASASKPIKDIPMLSIPREAEGTVVFCTLQDPSADVLAFQHLRQPKTSTDASSTSKNVLVKWHVEPPKGSGMVKVLRQLSEVRKQMRICENNKAIEELRTILLLLSGLSMADSSTGKELLKYEINDIESASGTAQFSSNGMVSSRRRATILSLVCNVLDDMMQVAEPDLECMGLCLSICASLASHAPGEVVQQLMSTEFLEGNWKIPVTVDAAQLEHKDAILRRLADSEVRGLPNLRKFHLQYEEKKGMYPVTIGLLEVLGVVLHRGITSGVVAEALGCLLPMLLSQTLKTEFAKPAQKYQMGELCIRVLRRGLQTVMSAARYARSNEEVDHRIAFTQALEAFISQTLSQHLPSAFPPPATVLEVSRVANSDLAVIKAMENLAKEVLSFVPILNQSQGIGKLLFSQQANGGGPSGAASLSSYLTYSHSDLKMRLLALQAIKVFLEMFSGTEATWSHKDLLVSDVARGNVANHALWRNTLVQSTGLVMAGIDVAVCCSAMECVKWSITNHHALMNEILFPTLLDKKESPTAMPWSRKAGQRQVQKHVDLLARRAVVGDSPDADNGEFGESGVRSADDPQNMKKSMSTGALSVLDCLWDLLQDSHRLLKEKPQSIAMALQVISVLVESAHMSPKHQEAAEIMKRQSGFWSCIASCVPARQTTESEREPDRSQNIAERTALQIMAVELSNYLKLPPGFKRSSNHKELLEVVRGWEREGWRGRSARINQLLLEREGTSVQEVGQASGSLATLCTSKSCVCLGIVVMILVIIIVFQRSAI